MEPAHLSTVEATAQYLGMTETELAVEIAEGRLLVVPPSDETLIHEADLEAFMNIPRVTVHANARRNRVRKFLRNPVRNR